MISNKKIRKHILVCLLLFTVVTGLMAHAVLPEDIFKGGNRYAPTPPPPGPVRPVAEFEPCSGVLIRYPLGFPVELVVLLADEVEVVCLVDGMYEQFAIQEFSTAGVNMANVSFLIAPTNSYWTRDYAPWFIVDGNDDFAAVGFTYDRPRPADNQVSQLFAGQYSYPYYEMNLQHNGGNYMTDGLSIIAQTTHVYSVNASLGEVGVNDILRQYLGAREIYGIPDPTGEYINHINCWGKFLARDKVLVRRVPSYHHLHNAFEETAAYFAERNCSWGYPWKVYRVDTPNGEPYANSMILNKKVYVPIVNSVSDGAALQVFRNALPGYEVIGVLEDVTRPWLPTDALHCRIHEIIDRGMLYVSHNPFWGVHNPNESFDIDVKIKAYSGAALVGDSLKVFYRVNHGNWESELLSQSEQDRFTCNIGCFAPGDTIRYYIRAADQSGRSADHPFTGALDPHLFVIKQAGQAPTIVHQTPVDVIYSDAAPVPFVAIVTDDVEVGDVHIRYYSDAMELVVAPMTYAGENYYIYFYSPDFGEDDHFLYYQIMAQDVGNPPNVSYFPSMDDWISIPLKVVSVDDPVVPVSGIFDAKIYPNPILSKDKYLRVECENPGSGELFWTIYNIRGQKLASGKSGATLRDDQLATIDVNLLENKITKPGVYLLKIGGKTGEKTCKFIVTN